MCLYPFRDIAQSIKLSMCLTADGFRTAEVNDLEIDLTDGKTVQRRFFFPTGVKLTLKYIAAEA